MPGCDRSAATFSRAAKRGRLTPRRRAHRSSSDSAVSGSSGMSESSSSTTIFCECRARALAVCTSIPGVGCRQHDGASTRSPLISTTQARQLPSGRIPGR